MVDSGEVLLCYRTQAAAMNAEPVTKRIVKGRFIKLF